MFDIGWSEMAVVAAVALVVIGPKDLPKLLRTVGEWTGKARAMAREFQGHLDDLARESELDELKKQAEKITSFDMKGEIANTIDPGGDIRKTVEAASQAAEADTAKLLGSGTAPESATAPESGTAPASPAAVEAPQAAVEAPQAVEGPAPEERKA
jgi:sec-independent protein translocase protein TatB